jgi:hypothetical protein
VTSIGRIIIVGPASPAALSSHLSGAGNQTDRKNVASLIRAGQRRTAGSPWTLPP